MTFKYMDASVAVQCNTFMLISLLTQKVLYKTRCKKIDNKAYTQYDSVTLDLLIKTDKKSTLGLYQGSI